ncbi:MAG: ABC transporter ATP-binding protein [Brevundimonas sp.]|nr:MAG: ABC transporter ATP-binding protein [Brevundimonas sp.]
MNRLELRDVTARLGGRTVLDGVSLRVGAGEFVALCGPNGAGKSSTIRVGLGLFPVQGGEVWLGGERLSNLNAKSRAEAAAYLPQERRVAWNMPARAVAALGVPFLSGGAADARADSALAEVEASHLAERGCADMSGGERARVLLARALAVDAPLLLADEPLAGLDPDAELMVMDRLKARTRAGSSVVASLHDLALAARYADRVVVIDQGRIVADAAPREALSDAVLADVFKVAGRWSPDGDLSLTRCRTA